MVIDVKGISKTFPGVRALESVDFKLAPGEIHALLGENGSGKSTLVKILAGLYKPDGGDIFYEGVSKVWKSPRDAVEAGIHVIYQELVMFPHLTVAENIFIEDMPQNRLGLVDYPQMERRASDALRQLGANLDVRLAVSDLSVADRQLVEIAKALVGPIKVLILDEPTAMLSSHESEMLFDRIAALKTRGVSIIYISHRMEEIFRLADRITVLKDGVLIGTYKTNEVEEQQLVEAMVGRRLSDYYPPKPTPTAEGPVVLAARNLTVANRVMNASLEIRAGEVLGLAGMVGSGRSELAMGIFGGMILQSGQVFVDGVLVDPVTPANMIANGVGLLSEDRKGEGLLLRMNIGQNITAAALPEITRHGFLDRRMEQSIAIQEMNDFGVSAAGPHTSVASLSGGNQQKVLFGRWVHVCKKVLLLDEPTRGVDVGAKAEIYRIIRRLASEGVAVLLISSELNEIIGLCDRVLVMRNGQINGELEGDGITEARVMALATRLETKH